MYELTLLIPNKLNISRLSQQFLTYDNGLPFLKLVFSLMSCLLNPMSTLQ